MRDAHRSTHLYLAVFIPLQSTSSLRAAIGQRSDVGVLRVSELQHKPENPNDGILDVEQKTQNVSELKGTVQDSESWSANACSDKIRSAQFILSYLVK